jgi:hypothetical protein
MTSGLESLNLLVQQFPHEVFSLGLQRGSRARGCIAIRLGHGSNDGVRRRIWRRRRVGPGFHQLDHLQSRHCRQPCRLRGIVQPAYRGRLDHYSGCWTHLRVCNFGVTEAAEDFDPFVGISMRF